MWINGRRVCAILRLNANECKRHFGLVRNVSSGDVLLITGRPSTQRFGRARSKVRNRISARHSARARVIAARRSEKAQNFERIGVRELAPRTFPRKTGKS